MKTNQMRVTLNFADDPVIREEFRNRIMESLTGMARHEIVDSIEDVIKAKLHESGLSKQIENVLTGTLNEFARRQVTNLNRVVDGENKVQWISLLEEMIQDEIRRLLGRADVEKRLNTVIENVIEKKTEAIIEKIIKRKLDFSISAAIK